MARYLKIALIQLPSFPTKQEAIANAINQIRIAAMDKGAKLVVLPECWNTTYCIEEFPRAAEPIPNGETSMALSMLASELGITLVGGTYPEVDNGKIYNTCPIWGPKGEFLGKYRKTRLLDVDIPGECTFKESSVLTPGSEFLIINVGNLKAGICIGSDYRFEAFYSESNCDLMIYPSAFRRCHVHRYTYPYYLEVITMARAMERAMYFVLCSPARGASKGYVEYGYSMVCNSCCTVLGRAKEGPEIVVANLDMRYPEYKRRLDFGVVYKK